MKTYVKYIFTLVAFLLTGVVGVNAENLDGFYTIKNNGNGKYVNVAGRKTVTFVSETTAPGTVLKVKSNDKGQVEVLRSQGVDIPHYAERAMSYVPELVKAIVERLNTELIGEAGANLISQEIIDKLDYHLYLESVGITGQYRLYGKTPSMDVVVDFYEENKDLINQRMAGVPGLLDEIITKIQDRLGDQYNIEGFTFEEIWEKMVAAGYTELPEPTDEDVTSFFEAIFTDKDMIWEFGHQIFMKYWDKVADKLKGNLGDYDKFIDKIPYLRPDCKYYFATDATGLDFVSESNPEANADRSTWTLESHDNFSLAIDKSLKLNDKFYTTFYADFAYTLPTGVKAYKVTKVSESGVAVKEELTGIIPAQTPVLLEAPSTEDVILTLSTEDGTAPSDNLLRGNDWLIDNYKLNASQMEIIMALLSKLSSSLGDQYEYLKRLNSGTVNNKYFFGLSVPTEEGDFKDDFNNGKIKTLSVGEDGLLAFYSNFSSLNGNQAFIFSDADYVKLTLRGDVKPDGEVNIADVIALVDIILGKVTESDKDHDFGAANVDEDEAGNITIADVSALLQIIIGGE